MVRRWGRMVGLLIIIAMAVPMLAQKVDVPVLTQEKDNKDAAKSPEASWNFYKLTLTVREMDGAKTVSTRSYDYSQRNKSWGSLRVGSRVPILGPNGSVSQYQDIGLNVDSRIEDRDNQLGFDWRLELTSLSSESDTHPVVRTVKTDGQTLLAMGKPTVVSTVDDLNSTHKFVFEVTAMKIK